MKLFQLLFYLLMNIAFMLLINTMIFNYGIPALWGYLFIVITNFSVFYLFSKNLVRDINVTYEKINNNNSDNLNIEKYDYSDETKELLKKFIEHKNSTQVTHDEKTEKESELKKSLETILNTTVDGIVFVNNTRDITIANESFFKLCGYRAFEISGNLRDLRPDQQTIPRRRGKAPMNRSRARSPAVGKGNSPRSANRPSGSRSPSYPHAHARQRQREIVARKS